MTIARRRDPRLPTSLYRIGSTGLPTCFVIPRRHASEPLMNVPPLGGRGECRMPAAPAVSCACCSGRRHTSNNEYTGITRHPRTQWFYGLFRALLGDRALLPPSFHGYCFV